MRCVLDPNVLVAALLSRRSAPAKLLRLWLDGAFELVASPLLLIELRRALTYPKVRTRVGEAEADAFLALVDVDAMIVDDPLQAPSVRTADPHVDDLVALTEATRSVIVSGDKHLLSMTDQLPVCGPAAFHDLLTTPDPP